MYLRNVCCFRLPYSPALFPSCDLRQTYYDISWNLVLLQLTQMSLLHPPEGLLAYWRLAVFLAFIVIWAALYSGRRRTELHNIAGPRSTSWYKGKHCCQKSIESFLWLLAGNFMDLISANGWQFHKDLEKNCTNNPSYVYNALTLPSDGKIATIPGILGVCYRLSSDAWNPTPDSDRQRISISMT